MRYPRFSWDTGQTRGGVEYDIQSHIDALVDAGVLEKLFNPLHKDMLRYPLYAVVQPESPHEHQWYVSSVRRTPPQMDHTVQIVCDGCRTVVWRRPDQFPIEVPG